MSDSSAAAMPPSPAPGRAGRSPGRDLVELLSSMRFAIALLSVICIASVIGTVVQQGQPETNYANQFGPFWSQVFGQLGVYTIYSAWWFLLILAFLVVSTTLCIARNLPKIRADLRTFKEQVREQSLKAHHHHTEGMLPLPPQAALEHAAAVLRARGWSLKADARANGTMLAAKKGGLNKIGYLLAHSAIVLVCIGGLVDGNLMIRLQMWAQGLTVTQGGQDAAKPEHLLSPANPSYRANLRVVEGERANLAVVTMPQGMLGQPLPFEVALDKFKVEYYSTGMPKLFASDIVIYDTERNVTLPATVEVNKPVIYRGVAIYQSSFEDGGSFVKLRAWPLGRTGAAGIDVEGRVATAQPLPQVLTQQSGPLTLEFVDLREINVENLAPADEGKGVDVRKVDLTDQLDKHLGAGNKGERTKHLRNVGPLVVYKLRDAAGQAREFQNYMLPVEIDGQRFYLFGQRDTPGEPFRYLRVPADDQGRLDGWMNLRAALADPAAREEAVRRFVARAVPPERAGQMTEQLRVSAMRALGLFAGALQPRADQPQPVAGLQALTEFIEVNVPEAERERTAEVLVRIVDGTLYELLNVSRERAGQPPLPQDEPTRVYMTNAALALSDSFFYGAPAFLTLSDYRKVQASVFQVARAPGKNVVYLGSLLLVLGVFAMLYVREKRLWVWVEPTPGSSGGADPHGAHLRWALSATRQTLDMDREFNELSTALMQGGGRTGPTPPAV